MKIDMEIIENEQFFLVPVAYNAYLHSYKRGNQIPLYEDYVNITDDFVEELFVFLDGIQKKKKVILDFKNVVSCNRGISKFDDSKLMKNIIFLNVDSGSSVYERINACISNLKKHTISDISVLCIDRSIDGIDNSLIDETYKSHIIELLKLSDVISSEEETTLFLDSSGIYSNTYLYMNKLFYSFRATLFICYMLAERVKRDDCFNNIDALISTSKTGAIVSTIVGKMLDKKTIHFLEVGPKYRRLEEQSLDKIRKHKNYFAISDFICLGTEIKIVNAIINCQGGNLLGGLAISSYIDLDNNIYDDSVLNNISSLTNINKLDINFKISGNKE